MPKGVVKAYNKEPWLALGNKKASQQKGTGKKNKPGKGSSGLGSNPGSGNNTCRFPKSRNEIDTWENYKKVNVAGTRGQGVESSQTSK